jgi:hypothetical protein
MVKASEKQTWTCCCLCPLSFGGVCEDDFDKRVSQNERRMEIVTLFKSMHSARVAANESANNLLLQQREDFKKNIG